MASAQTKAADQIGLQSYAPSTSILRLFGVSAKSTAFRNAGGEQRGAI